LLDNKKGLQRIFDTLNKNSEKNIFTSSELWDLFSQNNWLTKSFE
jgi:hypothetical protein